MTQLSGEPTPYIYSVVRAVPNPRRGECVNLGVILIAADGHFSDVRFGTVGRIRKLDSTADVVSIRSFLTGIMRSLPLHGAQMQVPDRAQLLSVDKLTSWSREFGGAIQLTELGAYWRAIPRNCWTNSSKTTLLRRVPSHISQNWESNQSRLGPKS